jgi:hypothetical protein
MIINTSTMDTIIISKTETIWYYVTKKKNFVVKVLNFEVYTMKSK